MKKFAGLIMALMLCACLYAQEAPQNDAQGGTQGEASEEPSAGGKKDGKGFSLKYGEKMWYDSGAKSHGYEMYTTVTVDRSYMMCTVDDIVDKGDGKYMVTFSMFNTDTDSSRTRVMLSKGSVIDIYVSYLPDNNELALFIFRKGELTFHKSMVVTDIDELGFSLSPSEK